MKIPNWASLVAIFVALAAAIIVVIISGKMIQAESAYPIITIPDPPAPPIQPIVPSPTPKYTIDQVIYVVQAKYPVGYKRESIGKDEKGLTLYQTLQTPTSVTATYVGGTSAAWKVEVSVPFGYRLEGPTTIPARSSLMLYFYESDASLRDKYYP